MDFVNLICCFPSYCTVVTNTVTATVIVATNTEKILMHVLCSMFFQCKCTEFFRQNFLRHFQRHLSRKLCSKSLPLFNFLFVCFCFVGCLGFVGLFCSAPQELILHWHQLFPVIHLSGLTKSVDQFCGGKMPLTFLKKAKNFFSVPTLIKISHALSLQPIQFYKRSEPSKKSHQMVSVCLYVHARFHTFCSQKFKNHKSDLNRKALQDSF